MASAATEQDFAGTVAEIVAHLDQDPVLVEEVMGNGHTEAIREALGAKAATSPVPVHVVLTKAPVGLTTDNTAEELLTLLHARSGEDGVWFVATADTGHTALAVYGDIDPKVDNDETELSLAVSRAEDQVAAAIRSDCADCFSTPVIEAGLVLDSVNAGLSGGRDDPLSPAQVDAYTASTWQGTQTRTGIHDDAEMPTPGLYAVVATMTALCVAVVAYRLLQAVGGATHPPLGSKDATSTRSPSRSSSSPVGRSTVRGPREELRHWQAKATAETRTLAGVLGSGDELDDWQRRDVASTCLDRAEPRIASDDFLEVLGALVLARTGMHALTREQGQYRCCYVDPRHGFADTRSPLGGGVSVPVCRSCAKSLERGSGLEPLTEETLAGRRPYYEGSTVWAMSGFGSLGGDWWKQVPR
ncbi:hypothetical protein ncot_04320 [Nocardioides sp. JQ2195]|uniref:hypothetical protein n=1 Tax=Nocardioides sp. JQ2195 TaxID=2592334 RepID=UPI00143E23C4|nr:hypothetical protein [Nocardioides sp. JQ2195]QIX25910.1 hypothetical protein ncot_04320 [Nocardioides sp. JQ2195]